VSWLLGTVGAGAVDLPSRWQELQLALPRNNWLRIRAETRDPLGVLQMDSVLAGGCCACSASGFCKLLYAQELSRACPPD
jgi:hypothetical protein